jgi:hypothetical protein
VWLTFGGTWFDSRPRNLFSWTSIFRSYPQSCFLPNHILLIIHDHPHISFSSSSRGSTVLLDPGRLTYRRFLELFRRMVGLLGRVISPSQGLYSHRTTQHRKTNIHALSGIQTHDPSNQPAKTHASDRTATLTGHISFSLRTICSWYIVTKYTSNQLNSLAFSLTLV